MPFDEEDNAYCAPMTGFRLMSTYSRTIGGIQVLCASLFGWIALGSLSMVVQREGTFKGVYVPPINFSNLYEGTMAALLSLSCFIGGCGLLGLRPWARRWEIAYLVLVSVLSMVIAIHETRSGRDLGYIVLWYMILALPYLPFLFISLSPCKVPLVGKVTIPKPVVNDLNDI
jgi:hypothetical protein